MKFNLVRQEINMQVIETVSARDIHKELGSKQKFSDWINNRIKQGGFIEGEDFIIILGKSSGGRPTNDYYTSIDMGKHLCLLERNDKGKKIRQYFIEVEKSNKPKQLSKAQEMMQQALFNIEVEETQLEQQKQLDHIKTETENVKAKIAELNTQVITSSKQLETLPDLGYSSIKGLKRIFGGQFPKSHIENIALEPRFERHIRSMECSVFLDGLGSVLKPYIAYNEKDFRRVFERLIATAIREINADGSDSVKVRSPHYSQAFKYPV